MGLGVMDLIRSPLGGGLFNLVQGISANRRRDRDIKKYVDPYNASLDPIAESLGEVGDTTQMAADQYVRAKGLAGQYSDQNVRDVNKRYDQLGASAQMGLRERGIGGSTVAPSVALGVERQRGDELRATNDARLTALLGVEDTFGGNQIAANQFAEQERLKAKNQRIIPLQGAPDMARIQPN